MFYRSLPVLLVALMASAFAMPASASSVLVVDFTVSIINDNNWDHPDYPIAEGDEFHGWFAYDTSSISGDQLESIDLDTGLLSLSFEMLGTTYTEADHRWTDDSPGVTFFNGAPIYINFAYADFYEYSEYFRIMQFGFDLSSDGFEAYANEVWGPWGDVTFAPRLEQPVDPEYVPLPAAAWAGLALFGLLGAGRAIRRRRAAAEPV